jgi:RNA recognition motif-containing protein
VKKIFIGQLPTDFVEQDLSNYFSQFGIIDTIELVDLEKKSSSFLVLLPYV